MRRSWLGLNLFITKCRGVRVGGLMLGSIQILFRPVGAHALVGVVASAFLNMSSWLRFWTFQSALLYL